MSTPAPPSLNLNRVPPLAFGAPLLSCPLARPHCLLLYPYFIPCEGKEMQQSKAYGLWQLAAPAQWQQLLHPQSLQPCFVCKHAERHAVRAVSGDHFVPSMCQVAYSTMGVEERKLPGAVCCTSHHFISTKKIILIEPAERLLLLHQETRKPKQTKRRNQQASFRARTALGGRRKEKKGRIVS